MEIVKAYYLFVLTAITMIVGGYLQYLWLKERG
jgi:drug/metabolite transporter superfamily protein YnfA